MAYEFSNQIVAKIKVSEDASGQDALTLGGINGREVSADSIMSAVTDLFGIVGWNVGTAVRIVNQDIQETS